MSYSTKYRLEYTGLAGYETKIEISKRNYSGSVIELKGSSSPFELTYDASEDYQFSKFKNSYCILSLIEIPELKVDFTEIADEDDFILRYYRDNTLYWAGYIMQEQYTESDDVNDPITLRFYDAISRLRIFTFDDLNLTVKSVYSLAEILNSVDSLLYTNFGGNRGVLWNDFLINTLAVNTNLLEVVFLQRASFFDRDSNAFNLYTILENIASTFNLTFSLYINRLMVSNFEFCNNPRFIDFSNNKNVVNFTKNINVNTNDNVRFVNISKQSTFLDALKKMEVFHRYNYDLTFFNNQDFDNSNNVNNTVDNNRIQFTTFARTNSWLDPDNIDPDLVLTYRDNFVNNLVNFKITKPNGFFDEKGEYILTFNYTINYTLNAEALNDTVKREELLDNTDLRLFFRLQGDVGGQNYTYTYEGFRNFPIPSPSPFLTSESAFTFDNDTYIGNVGELTGEQQFRGDFKLVEGLNEMTLTFFQPYLDTKLKASGNNADFLTFNYTITNITFVRVDRVSLEENRWEGTTDRNIFNYNLNRDKGFNYLNDLGERRYPNTLLSLVGNILPQSSFRRRLKNYSSNRTENLNIEDLLLIQSLEQFGFSQEKITGDLFVKGINNIDIMNSFTIDGSIYIIHKFSLNDYDSLYEVELIELK